VTASLADITQARLAREDRLARMGNDLTGCLCIRCGQFWATNAGPRDNFALVTKFCPDCTGTLPRLGGCVR
jgi:hypothetical protein